MSGSRYVNRLGLQPRPASTRRVSDRQHDGSRIRQDGQILHLAMVERREDCFRSMVWRPSAGRASQQGRDGRESISITNPTEPCPNHSRFVYKEPKNHPSLPLYFPSLHQLHHHHHSHTHNHHFNNPPHNHHTNNNNHNHKQNNQTQNQPPKCAP